MEVKAPFMLWPPAPGWLPLGLPWRLSMTLPSWLAVVRASRKPSMCISGEAGRGTLASPSSTGAVGAAQRGRESLGPQARAESLLAVGLRVLWGESTCEEHSCPGPAAQPHLLTHSQSPRAAGSVGSAGTLPVWAAPWGV